MSRYVSMQKVQRFMSYHVDRATTVKTILPFVIAYVINRKQYHTVVVVVVAAATAAAVVVVVFVVVVISVI